MTVITARRQEASGDTSLVITIASARELSSAAREGIVAEKRATNPPKGVNYRLPGESGDGAGKNDARTMSLQERTNERTSANARRLESPSCGGVSFVLARRRGHSRDNDAR